MWQSDTPRCSLPDRVVCQPIHRTPPRPRIPCIPSRLHPHVFEKRRNIADRRSTYGRPWMGSVDHNPLAALAKPDPRTRTFHDLHSASSEECLDVLPPDVWRCGLLIDTNQCPAVLCPQRISTVRDYSTSLGTIWPDDARRTDQESTQSCCVISECSHQRINGRPAAVVKDSRLSLDWRTPLLPKISALSSTPVGLAVALTSVPIQECLQILLDSALRES